MPVGQKNYNWSKNPEESGSLDFDGAYDMLYIAMDSSVEDP